MKARLRRHPTLTAAALFAVLAVGFVGQGLLPGRTLSSSDSFSFKAPWAATRPASMHRAANPGIDDEPSVLQPFMRYTIASLPHIPLWNPHIMTGRPFEANAQSAIFSPFSVPAYILPLLTALGWIAALKLWAAAFGMFLLARGLGMRFGGATVAGIVYGFCLFEVAWIGYPHASVWALIPWMMAATELAIRRPDVRGAAPLAIVVGLQFLAGHPESSFHAVVATGIYFVIRMFALRPDWRRPLIAFVGSMVLGTALAALALIPFVQLLLHSADIHQRAGTAELAPAEPKLLVTAFLPDWYGRPTQYYRIDPFEIGHAWYGSALALMLGVVALVLRPSRGRWLIAALGAAAMMVVLAIGPVFKVVSHLPLFSSGHLTRLAILALLCLALLAGYGMDDLVARVGSVRRRRVAFGAAAVVFVAPIVYALLSNKAAWSAAGHGLDVAWGFATYSQKWANLPAVDRDSAVWIWLVVAGLGLAIVGVGLLGRRRVGASVLIVAAALVIYGDLARAGMGFNPAIPKADATQPVTPAIRLLRTAGTDRFVAAGDPSEYQAIPQDVLPMDYGLYEARGYDLPIEQRIDHMWRTLLSPEYPSQAGPFPSQIPLSLPKVTPERLHMLDVMGTRFIVQIARDPRLRFPSLRLVHAGPDMQVYRNSAQQPRASIVSAQTVAPNGNAALADVAMPGFRIDRVAVTEKPIAGLPQTRPGAPPAPGGTARISDMQDDSVTVHATARRPGLLVLSDAWYPGWTATVDGHPATVHRVDYAFRGVRVGAGTHRIVFRFRPASWRIGWIISLVALLGLLGALGVSWWRARGRRGERDASAPATG